MNIWQFHLLAWQGLGCGWAIFISFIYTELLVWAFSQSYSLNLTYCLKSSFLHAFCFLLVSMVDQTQMCPSSILSLGLFQGIICNIEGLKGGILEPWITGGTCFGGISDPSSYHVDVILFIFCIQSFIYQQPLITPDWVSNLWVKHVLSITDHLSDLVLNKMNALVDISYCLRFYQIKIIKQARLSHIFSIAYFFISYVAAPRPTMDQWHGGSLTT